MAPVLAARSRALIASARATCGSSPFGDVATAMAFLTSVLAAARRGDSTSCRRAALRTRFRPDGVRAPVHVRGVLAKMSYLVQIQWAARRPDLEAERGRGW